MGRVNVMLVGCDCVIVIVMVVEFGLVLEKIIW